MARHARACAAALHARQRFRGAATAATGACRLQKETGMVLRFAIGEPPAELEQEVQEEEEAFGPLLRIPGKVGPIQAHCARGRGLRSRASSAPSAQDTYKTLTFKTVAFWEVVAAQFSARYVVKVDDDSYVRLDRLAVALGQWQAMGAGARPAARPPPAHRGAPGGRSRARSRRVRRLLQGQGQQREPPAAAHAPLV